MPAPFTYTPNWPIATDSPSVAPTPFQQNFQGLKDIVGVDHVTFSNSANEGRHNKSTYLDQGGDPGSAANQSIQYAKTTGGTTDIYIQHDGVIAPVRMTQLASGTPIAAGTGQTFLPGGIILKWGQGNTAVPVTFAPALPNFPTALFKVWLTVYNGAPFAISVIPGSEGVAGFTAIAGAPGLGFLWFAIGN